MKKQLNEEFKRMQQLAGIITENTSDNELEKNINNLTAKDLHWSKDPKNGLNISYNFDDVDEELLILKYVKPTPKIAQK
jgi:hypothetical protein